MEILILWFIGSVIVGVIASANQRAGFGYFILSLLLSPLLVGLIVLVLGKPAPTIVVAPAEPSEAITPDTHVRCPDCRELVRKDARKCKHCGTALTPLT
jgi:hypothetical protein